MINLIRIELFKIVKRKDFWLMLSMIFLPIMYAVGLSNNAESFSYEGTERVSALGYASEMMVFVYMCFIYFIILSVCVIRSLKGEIENKSILLYVQRVKNRKDIYSSKFIAYILLLLVITVLFIMTSIIFYKSLLVQRQDVASGLLLQSGELVSISCTIISIILCFIFTISVALFLSAWLKSFQAMGVFIFLWLGLMYVKEFTVVNYLAPIHYVELIINTENNSVAIRQSVYLMLLVCVVSLLCYELGYRKFVRSDL